MDFPYDAEMAHEFGGVVETTEIAPLFFFFFCSEGTD